MNEQGKIIGKNLRNAREYLGLTEEKVTENLGMRRADLQGIEVGDIEPSKDLLKAFSRLYRHPIDFFSGSPLEDHPPTQILARAVEDLSENDRNQISRFARVLIEMGKER